MIAPERIKELLDACPAPLTGDQSELARRLGITSQAVNQWVAGKSHPRPQAIPKLAEALGVAVGSLYEPAGTPPTPAAPAVTPQTDAGYPMIVGYGSRLRETREQMGKQAARLARELGVSALEYEAWEAETSAPPAGALGALSRVHGVDLDWLLTGIKQRVPLLAVDHQEKTPPLSGDVAPGDPIQDDTEAQIIRLWRLMPDLDRARFLHEMDRLLRARSVE